VRWHSSSSSGTGFISPARTPTGRAFLHALGREREAAAATAEARMCAEASGDAELPARVEGWLALASAGKSSGTVEP